MKDALSDCNFKGDIERIKAMGEIFASPWTFAYHVGKDILVNGMNIYNEINGAVNAYDHQQWENFGYNIGEAAA